MPQQPQFQNMNYSPQNPNFNYARQNMRGPMNQNMRQGFQQPANARSVPFNTPRSATAAAATATAGRGLLSGGIAKGFNISKILGGTQNMIATVNQAIPIYQQIKPLVTNSKAVTSAVKKFFKPAATATSQSTSTHREVITDPEIITPNRTRTESKPEEKKEFKDEFVEQKKPNRPFF